MWKPQNSERIRINRYGQEALKIILINIYQGICQGNLWALVMITEKELWNSSVHTAGDINKVRQSGEKKSHIKKWTTFPLPQAHSLLYPSLIWASQCGHSSKTKTKSHASHLPSGHYLNFSVPQSHAGDLLNPRHLWSTPSDWDSLSLGQAQGSFFLRTPTWFWWRIHTLRNNVWYPVRLCMDSVVNVSYIHSFCPLCLNCGLHFLPRLIP